MLRLDVGIIESVGLRDAAAILRHAFEDKLVQPVARPAIARTERLQDDKRLTKIDGPLHRAVQAMIRNHAPRRDHPVEDVIARRVGREVADNRNSRRRNNRRAGHR